MSVEKTVPHPYLGQRYIGYVLNTPLSKNGQNAVQELQQKYIAQFGDAIFISPPETLHITLMDWLAPLVDYQADKDVLFEDIYQKYDEALASILRDIGSIAIHFNSVCASAEAVFIKGNDSGQYQAIRQGFLDKITLLPNTKHPPEIIHSTVARFLEEVDLKRVQYFTAQQNIDFVEHVECFRLIRSTNTTMDKLRVLKRYELK
jgi:2'-5' RNA ligase